MYAVVLSTRTSRPMLPIRIVLIGPASTFCRRGRKKRPPFRFPLLALPSLLLELASGTLVSALRMPGRGSCGRLAAVISPCGGKCELYSSARLMRFFAQISAMPVMADWNSALSAERRISAKVKDEMGGSVVLLQVCRCGVLIGDGMPLSYVLTRSGVAMLF